MGLFGNKKPKTQQVVGTPQSPVSSGVSVTPPAPAFDDPEDALRWQLMLSVHAALAEMMDKYQQCFEKAENVERAFAVADGGLVNGVPQHEISRKNFRALGVHEEGELEGLLPGLRAATVAAESQWKQLAAHLPGPENDVIRVGHWCISHGVAPEIMSYVLSNAVFTRTDFGLTRQSFWTENDRVIAAMKGAGQ